MIEKIQKIQIRVAVVTLLQLCFVDTAVFAQRSYAPQVDQIVSLNVKEHAAVLVDRIFVSDVAECDGRSELCEEVSYIELRNSAEPSKKTVISAQYIAETVAAEIPDLQVTMLGSSKTEITTRFTNLSAMDVQNALERYLKQTFIHKSDYRVSVSSVKMARTLPVYEGAADIVFPSIVLDGTQRENLSTFLTNKSRFQEVKFTVSSDVSGQKLRVYGKAMVEFFVEKKLPVLRNNIARGKVIKANDIYTQWFKLGYGYERLAHNVSDISGKIAKRNLPMGMPVYMTHIEQPDLVKRGDLVLAIIKRGNLVIRSKVKALTSGHKDENVNVLYEKNKKRLRAKVVSEGLVEVKL